MTSASPTSYRRALLVALFFALALAGLIGFLMVMRHRVGEQTKVDLPVKDFKKPVDRQEHTVQLRAQQQYATIDIPFDSIAMNKHAEIVGFVKRGDGQVDMMLWIAGSSFNVSELVHESFSQVLDINDNREVLGVIKKDGRVFLKGYSYALKDGKLTLEPLKRVDLRSFGLEDLTVETDLTLDSTLGQVEGRKVKVRSIIDMTDRGVILGRPEKASPSPSQP